MNCVSCALGFIKGYKKHSNGCYERAGLSIDGLSECYYGLDASSAKKYCLDNAPDIEDTFDVLLIE